MTDIADGTRAEIERRKAEARPVMLADMSLVIAARGGAVTEAQIALAAGLLARMVAADDLHEELLGWLHRSGVRGDAMSHYLGSDGWLWLLDRAQQVAAGGADRRPDPTIEQCRAGFDIGREDAERLGLEKLVDESRISKLRRTAEGATSRRGRPPRADRPWVELKIPERTWRDREARRLKAEKQALADSIAIDSHVRRKFDPSEGDISLYNRVEFSADRAAELTYYGALEELPNPTATASEATTIPGWARRTAEAKRLAALAQGLGMVFGQNASEDHPDTWWQQPCGVVLCATDAAKLEKAVASARQGKRRREIITEAGFQKRARDSVAKVRSDTAPVLAPRDADWCPPLVSPEVWDAVPLEIRGDGLRYAAMHHRRGQAGDRAMTLGAQQALRTKALACAVAAFHPDIHPDEVVNAAEEREEYWMMATEDAIPAIAADLRASWQRLSDTQRVESLWQIRRSQALRRVHSYARDHYQPFDGDVDYVAGKLLDRDRTLADQPPSVVADLAWRNILRIKAENTKT